MTITLNANDFHKYSIAAITLPPVTPDEYNHIMRLLGAPSEIGTRSIGEGLTGDGVNGLRARFAAVKPVVALDYDRYCSRTAFYMDGKEVSEGEWMADPRSRPYNPSTVDL